MAAHLDDLEERADDLSEDYAQAVYELQQLDDQVAQAKAQMDAADAALGQTRDRIQHYAVNAYVQFDQTSDLMVFLGSTPDNTEARIGYADIAVGKDRALADTWRSASEDAAVARSDLISQRERQATLQAQVMDAKKAARASGDDAAARAHQRAGSARHAREAGAGSPGRRGGQGRSSPPAAESVGAHRLVVDRGAQRAVAVGRRDRCHLPRRAASSACRTAGRTRVRVSGSTARV